MTPELVEVILSDATSLVWKLWYYSRESDADLLTQLDAMSKGQKSNLESAFRRAARNYCFRVSRSREEPNDPNSPFIHELSWLYERVARNGEFFRTGSPTAGLSIVECCLKWEGWELTNDSSEVAWREAMHSVDLDDANFDKLIDPIIKEFWRYTGNIDESNFQAVEDFRARYVSLIAMLD